MLLESHLAEIGISAEDFVEICMKAKAAGALNTDVIQQILAVEDFLSAYARCFHVCAISLCCVTVRTVAASRAAGLPVWPAFEIQTSPVCVPVCLPPSPVQRSRSS